MFVSRRTDWGRGERVFEYLGKDKVAISYPIATSAQIGKWSEARDAREPCSTPAFVRVRPFDSAIRSSAATGRRAWKLWPGAWIV